MLHGDTHGPQAFAWVCFKRNALDNANNSMCLLADKNACSRVAYIDHLNTRGTHAQQDTAVLCCHNDVQILYCCRQHWGWMLAAAYYCSKVQRTDKGARQTPISGLHYSNLNGLEQSFMAQKSFRQAGWQQCKRQGRGTWGRHKIKNFAFLSLSFGLTKACAFYHC